MDYDAISKKVEAYVTELFERTPHAKLAYHDLLHTTKVVNRTREIASHYSLIDTDLLVLHVASWFHDTGYLFNEVALHEEKSVQLMRDFMKDLLADSDILNTIEECILATKPGNKPANLLQQILVDADTYHFGTKEIEITNKQVYDEYMMRGGYISKREWDRQTIKMLENHHYYTSYCKELLTERKKKNIKKLKRSIQDEPDNAPAPVTDKQTFKAANNLTTKGIQTMLRLTSENHMRLSDMADGKANILISVNAIIISVILSVLMRRLQTDTYLTIPTIIFLSSSVCTIVVAILATRPKISSGRFSEMDIDTKKTNLLFFGNFYKCTQEEYEKAMAKMMVDAEYLYGSLVKDIYQLGVVLARKYRLIRWAYNIFMIGIIVSVIAFAAAVIISNNAGTPVAEPVGSPL
jgi:HD superfamily phosphodiesterase